MRTSSIYICCLALLLCTYAVGQDRELIRGITMVAPPQEIGIQEMKDLQRVEAEWVALVPYGFSRIDDPEIRYSLQRQWWGERKEGLRASIRLAHQAGLSVMVKPQVYIHGAWVGDVDFDTEDKWVAWEESYRSFIMDFAALAQEEDVEMLCIGTEYKIAVRKRVDFWRKIIKEIRAVYDGKLIYSSNWDAYDRVEIWDDLDYIGVSAYFPLSDQQTPTVNLLKNKWKPIVRDLKRYAQKYDRPIVFTEYGYLTVDGCAWEAWNLEVGVQTRPINQLAQANAYQALYEAFWEEPWWAGGFLWKWFPAGMGHEGYPERDYTPQGKKSEAVVRSWYGQ